MRKRCKRKVRPLLANPIGYAIENASMLDDGHLERIRLIELGAIDDFQYGRATIASWQALTDMLNVTEYLGRHGVGPEALADCARLQDALVESARRMARTGKMGMTGEGLTAAKEVYQWAELQRTSITVGEFSKAINSALSCVRSKSRGVVDITDMIVE